MKYPKFKFKVKVFESANAGEISRRIEMRAWYAYYMKVKVSFIMFIKCLLGVDV